jgi:hypothetical protein
MKSRTDKLSKVHTEQARKEYSAKIFRKYCELFRPNGEFIFDNIRNELRNGKNIYYHRR